MKRFSNDIKKFRRYLMYAAKSRLKSEVASSRLNWLWWVLDPLLFMCVYTFISLIVFRKGEAYFPVYVFIGLTSWNFFNKCVQASVGMVKRNSSIVKKIYVPKYIFIIQRMLVEGFKMSVSFLLVVVLMILFKVPVSWNVLFFIPTTFTLIAVTFGISTIVMHFGVFFEDLNNVMTIGLKFMFYMSGIFYSIEKNVPEPYCTLMMRINPIAGVIKSYRDCLLYAKTPAWQDMILWLVLGIIIAMIGVATIYKNENNYAKVI